MMRILYGTADSARHTGHKKGAWQTGLAAMLAWGLCGTHAVCQGKTDAERISQDLAQVVTATYLGSEGNEWLSAAAFPGDDSIIIGGVSLDSEITLHGVRAAVLGADAPPVKSASLKEFVRIGEQDAPKPKGRKPTDPAPTSNGAANKHDNAPPMEKKKTTKEEEEKQRAEAAALASLPGTLRWTEDIGGGRQVVNAKFYWSQPDATGFIGRFSSDLKRVLTLRRLPRGAGSITSVAIDKTGAVYITGAATDRIAGLSGGLRTETYPNPVGVADDTWGCRRTYLAKLSADLSKVVWVVEVKGWSFGPKLRVLNDGNISLLGPGLRVYAPDGQLVRSVALPNRRVISGSAVDPATGRYTRVGDNLTKTGREPYRDPYLKIHNPDGTLHEFLYSWGGPYVVLDSLRLVADSAIRRSAYDADGNLVISSWSHGGNNVLFRYPYDMERWAPNGLGYNQSHSVAYVVKMGPDHNLLASTAWTSTAFINTLACAVDGSVVWAGSCNQILRLPNAISDRPDGSCIVVTDPDLGAYRFISALPVCGNQVATGGCFERPDAWGFASGTCQGWPMLICLTGVVRGEKQPNGPELAGPVKNPVQAGFGGGLMDGYALLLDLSKIALPGTKAPAASGPPARLSVNRYARAKNRKPGKNDAVPDEGEVFHFRPSYPKWTTVDAEFRDANGKFWPSFCYGKPVSGQIKWEGGQPQGAFEVACTAWCQTEGDQSQRILGSLLQPPKDALPTVTLRVTALGPLQTKEVSVDVNGKTETRDLVLSEATGELEVGGKVIKVRPQCVISVAKAVESEIRKTQINAVFTVKGQDLGLTGARANADIDVRVGAQAHAGDVPPSRR